MIGVVAVVGGGYWNCGVGWKGGVVGAVIVDNVYRAVGIESCVMMMMVVVVVGAAGQ